MNKLDQTINECENLLFTLNDRYDYSLTVDDVEESPWNGAGEQIEALEVGIRYLKMMRNQQLKGNN